MVKSIKQVYFSKIRFKKTDVVLFEYPNTFILNTNYLNGTEHFCEKYTNGLLNGKSCVWHINGRLEYERNWKNGILDGPYREYDYFGRLVYSEEYENGKIKVKK